jgi:hypothetical protein
MRHGSVKRAKYFSKLFSPQNEFAVRVRPECRKVASKPVKTTPKSHFRDGLMREPQDRRARSR